MGMFSLFKGREKVQGREKGPKTVGETGPEDEIILTIIEEADGATAEEIKEHFRKKEKEISNDALNSLLEKLVREGRIYWNEKLRGYYFQDPGQEG